MTDARIRKSWYGFVPAWRPHPRSLCAHYHCVLRRDAGRYCETHAAQYDHEALAQGGAVVLAFPFEAREPEPLPELSRTERALRTLITMACGGVA